MIFGFRLDKGNSFVDGLINEWNEIFREPARNIISETRYYKVSDGTYILKVKPMFPITLWFFILGLGVVSSLIFGMFKTAVVLSVLLLFISLFKFSFMYMLGTKFRLKKAGYKGKLHTVSNDEILEGIYREVEDES